MASLNYYNYKGILKEMYRYGQNMSISIFEEVNSVNLFINKEDITFGNILELFGDYSLMSIFANKTINLPYDYKVNEEKEMVSIYHNGILIIVKNNLMLIFSDEYEVEIKDNNMSKYNYLLMLDKIEEEVEDMEE